MSLEYEIIIVDNASNDISRNIFEKYPGITYIYSDINLGFGKANNLGASHSTGRYLFFLNSDTLLTDNIVFKMLSVMDNNEFLEYSCCGCILKDAMGKQMHSAGTFPSIYSETIGIYLKKQNQINLDIKNHIPVDYITGADLFIRRSDFDSVNGFSRDFFMYYEETDLQKRLAIKGKKSLLLNYMDIFHLEGGSFKSNKSKTPISRLQMQLDSRLVYMKSHTKKSQYIIFRLLYALLTIPAAIMFRCDIYSKIKYIKKILSF